MEPAEEKEDGGKGCMQLYRTWRVGGLYGDGPDVLHGCTSSWLYFFPFE